MANVPPPTPLFKTVVYDAIDVLSLPVGATALQYGDLCKWSSNLIVPLAADDKQLDVYVALENCPAASTRNASFVPFRKVSRLEMAYTAAPGLGVAYGVDDARTLDQSDTTNKLLVVTSLDTNRATCDVVPYLLTA